MTTLLWGFQAPILLFALLGLLVPLAIHIFSKSKGRRVAFGSLNFIKQSKPVKMTQLRLVEPLLLLLRILLLIITVLFLARMFISSSPSSQASISFVSEDWLNSANLEQKKQLLLKPNTSRFLLKVSSTGALENQPIALTPNDVLKWQDNRKTLVNYAGPINMWSLVDQAISYYPNIEEFSVYTTDRLNQFYGDKLALFTNILWNILAVNQRDELSNVAIKILPISIIGVTQDVISSGEINNEYADQVKLKNALELIIRQFPQISVKYISYPESQSLNYLNEKNTLTADWIIYLAKNTFPESLLPSVAKGASLLISDSNNISVLINRKSVADAISSDNLLPFTHPFKKYRLNDLSKSQITLGSIGEIYSLSSQDKKADLWHELLQSDRFPQQLLNLLISKQNKDYLLEYSSLTKPQIEAKLEQETSIKAKDKLTDSQLENFKADNSIALNKKHNNDPAIQFVLFVLLLIIWASERLVSEFATNKAKLISEAVVDD